MKRAALVLSLSIGVALTTLGAISTSGPWNVTSDLLRTSNEISFSEGHDTWYFLESQTPAHNPATYKFLPTYLALCKADPIAQANGLACWIDPNGVGVGSPNLQPLVGINTTNGVITPEGGVSVPPRSVFVHPAPARNAIIAWQSPTHGTMSVTGTFSDLDAACGNGVIWSIDTQTATLKTDVLGNGGAPEAFSVQAVLNPGDVLYFVVDAGSGDYACDTTGVQITIRRVA